MKEFIATFTSGHRYDGFRLQDRAILFTKSVLTHAPKKFALLYDEEQEIIKLEYRDNAPHQMPKDGRYNINLKDLPMPRGRYIHQGEEIYKLAGK